MDKSCLTCYTKEKELPMKKRYYLYLLILALILWGFVENTLLGVTEITVIGANLPEGFPGCRIAQVSDLHNAEFGKDNKRLLALLEEAQPDLIAITGDLVDSRRTDPEVAIAFAREAVKIAPCYYVTGNHESRIEEYPQLEQQLTKAGVTVLRGQRITLDNGITIAGVDDPAFTGFSAFSETLAQLAGEEYTVLLSHRPEHFDLYCQAGFDLVLSGHVHGGQFRIPFLGGVLAPGQGFFPTYDAGLYTGGQTNLVVSRGLGNSLFPFRLNNPPEVILITLQTQ